MTYSQPTKHTSCVLDTFAEASLYTETGFVLGWIIGKGALEKNSGQKSFLKH